MKNKVEAWNFIFGHRILVFFCIEVSCSCSAKELTPASFENKVDQSLYDVFYFSFQIVIFLKREMIFLNKLFSLRIHVSKREGIVRTSSLPFFCAALKLTHERSKSIAEMDSLGSIT